MTAVTDKQVRELGIEITPMFADLGKRLDSLHLAVPGIPEKIAQFTGLLGQLQAMASRTAFPGRVRSTSSTSGSSSRARRMFLRQVSLV